MGFLGSVWNILTDGEPDKTIEDFNAKESIDKDDLRDFFKLIDEKYSHYLTGIASDHAETALDHVDLRYEDGNVTGPIHALTPAERKHIVRAMTKIIREVSKPVRPRIQRLAGSEDVSITEDDQERLNTIKDDDKLRITLPLAQEQPFRYDSDLIQGFATIAQHATLEEYKNIVSILKEAKKQSNETAGLLLNQLQEQAADDALPAFTDLRADILKRHLPAAKTNSRWGTPNIENLTALLNDTLPRQTLKKIRGWPQDAFTIIADQTEPLLTILSRRHGAELLTAYFKLEKRSQEGFANLLPYLLYEEPRDDLQPRKYKYLASLLLNDTYQEDGFLHENIHRLHSTDKRNNIPQDFLTPLILYSYHGLEQKNEPLYDDEQLSQDLTQLNYFQGRTNYTPLNKLPGLEDNIIGLLHHIQTQKGNTQTLTSHGTTVQLPLLLYFFHHTENPHELLQTEKPASLLHDWRDNLIAHLNNNATTEYLQISAQSTRANKILDNDFTGSLHAASNIVSKEHWDWIEALGPPLQQIPSTAQLKLLDKALQTLEARRDEAVQQRLDLYRFWAIQATLDKTYTEPTQLREDYKRTTPYLIHYMQSNGTLKDNYADVIRNGLLTGQSRLLNAYLRDNQWPSHSPQIWQHQRKAGRTYNDTDELKNEIEYISSCVNTDILSALTGDLLHGQNRILLKYLQNTDYKPTRVFNVWEHQRKAGRTYNDTDELKNEIEYTEPVHHPKLLRKLDGDLLNEDNQIYIEHLRQSSSTKKYFEATLKYLQDHQRGQTEQNTIQTTLSNLNTLEELLQANEDTILHVLRACASQGAPPDQIQLLTKTLKVSRIQTLAQRRTAVHVWAHQIKEGKQYQDLQDVRNDIKQVIDNDKINSFDLHELVTIPKNQQHPHVYRIDDVTPQGYILTDTNTGETLQSLKQPDQLKSYNEGKWQDITRLNNNGYLVAHSDNAYRGEGLDNLRSDLTTDVRYSFSCSILHPDDTKKFNIATPEVPYSFGVTLDSGKIYKAFTGDAATSDDTYYRTTGRERVPIKSAVSNKGEHQDQYNEALPQNWTLRHIYYTTNTPEEKIKDIKTIRKETGRTDLPIITIDLDSETWQTVVEAHNAQRQQ